MNMPVVTLDHLKSHVLPQLFQKPASIGEYGNLATSSANMDKLSSLMENGAASALAAKIAEVLSKMADASPERSPSLRPGLSVFSAAGWRSKSATAWPARRSSNCSPRPKVMPRAYGTP